MALFIWSWCSTEEEEGRKNKADKKVQELHEFYLEGEYYHINID